MYALWKNHPDLPLECLVNAVLLYSGDRVVVQFDLTYYADPIVRKTIAEFASQLRDVVVRHVRSENIIVYTSSSAALVEGVLKRNGSGSIEFARMLDEQFYVCESVVEQVLERPAPVRVGMFVVAGHSKVGAILVQMCSRAELSLHTERLYRRFLSISHALETIDPELQTELSFYTKPGMWKASPEYVPCGLRELSPVVGTE